MALAGGGCGVSPWRGSPHGRPVAADAGVAFLQWALPRLGLRWPGFRKVRGQVLKRVGRRMRDLGLASLDDYRRRLASDPAEWSVLSDLCRVTISRFRRDRGVWDALGEVVLPGLARRATAAGARTLRCWSAGCASGEEPHTLAILWRLELADRYPGLRLDVLATDIDEAVLARAGRAVYPRSALKEVPDRWLEVAFAPDGAGTRGDRSADDVFTLRPEFRAPIRFVRHDLAADPPPGDPGGFQLILCRNLAFTYLDLENQRRVLGMLRERLAEGGVLVVGAHEELPDGGPGFSPGPVREVHRRARTEKKPNHERI
ncbi:chemotaxis protein CheR [bacterium]|nr:chemotaxis protein CheR [bacterium]